MTTLHKKIILALVTVSAFTQNDIQAGKLSRALIACLKACLGRNSHQVTDAANSVIAMDGGIAVQNIGSGEVNITAEAPVLANPRPNTPRPDVSSKAPSRMLPLSRANIVFATGGGIAAQNHGTGRISIDKASPDVSPRAEAMSAFEATYRAQSARARTSLGGIATDERRARKSSPTRTDHTNKPPRASAATSARRNRTSLPRTSEYYDLPGMVSRLAQTDAGTGEMASKDDVETLKARIDVATNLLRGITSMTDSSAADFIATLTNNSPSGEFKEFDEESQTIANTTLEAHDLAEVKKVLRQRYMNHLSNIFARSQATIFTI